MSKPPHLSHIQEDGKSRMVDVGDKSLTRREAEAEALVRYPQQAFEAVLAGKVPKGGVVEPARLAGLMAAKRTSELIPMCHQIALDGVSVDITPQEGGEPVLQVRCRAWTSARTGVEMEAMVGASVAALTLYDMTKALDKGIFVENVRLLRKSGGKSGAWQAQ